MRYIFGLILIFIIASCQEKTPDAYFKVSNEGNLPGKEIKIINQTIEGHFFKWEVLNYANYFIEEFSTKDLTYTPSKEGQYSITLKAYSKNKTKSDEYSKSLIVEADKGKVIFYRNFNYSACTSGDIFVTISPGNHEGSIYSSYNYVPNCTTTYGNYIKELESGEYSYTARHGYSSNCKKWSGNFTITKNGCYPILMAL
ncbi:MAG: hypothetical protein H0V01_11105 [Bacteroidetes bacterium]|nr:hypothetical protein [Bacteroidota bacterium]HET6244498.1 hypothetical protein [Bacteroidia bacterium]